MKHLLSFLLLLLVLPALAQTQNEGVVSYERTTNWVKLINRLTFLSKEEKDRAAQTWKNDSDHKEKMKLVFNADKSLYTWESDRAESEDGSWSWRQQDLVMYRDFAANRKTDIVEMLTKVYVIEDSLRTPTWKIMNQLKDIAGHVCMKAVTEDTVKNQKITAWFSQDLALSMGPEQYFGLPGMIMELDINEGDVVITATKVEYKPVEKELALPKKIKGKKINDTQYDQLISTHIRDSMKAYRNPYWSIRY